MADSIDTDWFKARIRALDINQEQIGEALGCERSVVSKIINGRQPLRLDQVMPLAEALDVSPFEILRRAGFWAMDGSLAAEWAALHDQIPAEDRPGIIDAIKAFARRR